MPSYPFEKPVWPVLHAASINAVRLPHSLLPAPLRQRPHDALKRNQGHGIGGKRPQEARQEPSPVRPPPALPPHGDGGVPPAGEPPRAVAQPAAQRVRHDALLDQVARVARQPEDLGAEPARPEVDGGRRQRRVAAQRARQHVVAAPPEEEEAAEEQRRREPVV